MRRSSTAPWAILAWAMVCGFGSGCDDRDEAGRPIDAGAEVGLADAARDAGARDNAADAVMTAGCNTIPNTAMPVSPVMLSSRRSDQSGGAILDGIYELTGVQQHPSAGALIFRRTIAVTGGGRVIDWVVDDASLAGTARVTAAASTRGTELSLAAACGQGAFSLYSHYTATPTTLVLYASRQPDLQTVYTFTKR